MSVGIITTLKNPHEIMRLYAERIGDPWYGFTTVLEWHRDMIFNEPFISGLPEQIRMARKNETIYVIQIEKPEHLETFPQSLQSFLFRNCIYIGDLLTDEEMDRHGLNSWVQDFMRCNSAKNQSDNLSLQN